MLNINYEKAVLGAITLLKLQTHFLKDLVALIEIKKR